TSLVIAEAIRRLNEKEPVGLVICGRQTIDGDTAQVGPGIATRLGYTQLTLVESIEGLDLEANKVRVKRKLEGRRELVVASLPVLLTVVREINRPRYPTVPRRLEAEDIPVALWDNKVMKLDEATTGLKGSATQVRKIFSPERVKGEIVGDGLNKPDEAAALLVEELMKKDII
ncbi:MAG: electron transfer flavoprotein subunit beta, partial [Dehalococcoidales bacterium]